MSKSVRKNYCQEVLKTYTYDCTALLQYRVTTCLENLEMSEFDSRQANLFITNLTYGATVDL